MKVKKLKNYMWLLQNIEKTARRNPLIFNWHFSSLLTVKALRNIGRLILLSGILVTEKKT